MWCPSCRAHTRSKGSERSWRDSNGAWTSATTWTCLHCRGTSFVPWERLYWGCTVGGLTAFLLTVIVIITTAAMFELESSRYLLIAVLSASSFAAVLCTRLMHRFTRYRDWSQWAKEQKANKPS